MRLLALLALASMSVASAATLWDNGSPDYVNGYFSDTDATTNPAFQRVVQDDFTLSSTQTLRSIVWWGGYGLNNVASTTDVFTIQILDGTGVLATYGLSALRSPTGTIGSFDIYSYTAGIPETVLSAGTYSVRIFNDTSTNLAANWFWATSAQTGNAIQDLYPPSSPTNLNAEMAFVLSDTTVPEPSAFLLSAAGLAGLFAFRRYAR